MEEAEEQGGCRAMMEWGSAALLLVGAVAFVPLQGTGFVPFLGGWLAIVVGSLVVAACGLSAAIDRMAPSGSRRPRGALTAGATLVVAAMAVWSGWMLIGPPAVGTLAEAVPLIVDPALAAALALPFVPRSERWPVVGFGLAAIVVIAVVLRFVAAVGPTYGS